MMASPDVLALLLTGALLGAGFLLVARSARRHTRTILFAGLVAAAVVYVGFAWSSSTGGLWLLVELGGVAFYGAVGYRGLRGSPMWLAAGWTLHPLWDVPLHFAGPGAAFAPASYTLPCLSFDLVVSIAIALATIRRSRPAVSLLSGAAVPR